ncbi:hypothetical protein QBC34DRAFT_383763 [Podospora aff. communis PSN243]|uniref:Uncharacterized protein n=1 Tax=Podospora aff. communis PSN243 TaxID=3040156 RepID=A0AAV9GCF3_9PEZI|nr:hypothetical protein QBC34DRAFT_383763 [Podospora aff. communis PSN243]
MVPAAEDTSPDAPNPDSNWKADLKSGLISASGILYITTILISTFMFLQYLRQRWPVFRKEMCLILTAPFVCLILGCLWPLAVLAVVCDWLCGADKSWCGIECAGVRRKMGVRCGGVRGRIGVRRWRRVGRKWGRGEDAEEGEAIVMVDREEDEEDRGEGVSVVVGNGYGKGN